MKQRATFIYGLSIVLIAAAVYILTACRTVFVGDSGELTLALTTGGIAHPPGYPLYTIVGYLWLKLLFFLNPALAANLFSAAAAVATSLILFHLIKEFAGRHLPPIISAGLALTYALAYPVWSSATNAEVYALSGFLYAMALYMVLRFHRDGRRGSLLVAAFFCGLTLAHHYSAGVIFAALILALIYRKDGLPIRSLIPAIIMALIPMTLYLYLFFRFDPGLPINWMAQKSMAQLWAMISGANYQQFMGTPTLGDMALFAGKTTVTSLTSFGPGLVLLAVPGIIVALMQRIRLALLILTPAVLNLLMVATYHIPDYEGYLLPAVIGAVMMMAFFLEWLWARYRPGRAVGWIVAGLLVATPLAYNYPRCNLGDFRLAKLYGRDLLDSAGPNSIVFLKSDNGAHTALYLRYAENYRPDLQVYSFYSTLTRLRHRFGGEDYATIMTHLENGADRIFWGTEYIINQGMNPSASDKSMRGLLYGRSGDDDDPELNQRIDDFIINRLPRINLRGDLKARQIYLEYQLHRFDRLLQQGVSPALSQGMYDLLKWGKRLDNPMTCLAVAQFFRARGVIDQSLKWADLARTFHPYSYERRDIYVNLGIIYRQAGDLGLAGQALSQALQIDPDYDPARYNAYLVKAEMAIQKQEWSAALEAFAVLTHIEPDNPLPYFNMAVIYERLPNRTAEAVEYYKKFIAKSGEEQSRAVDRARERIDALESMSGQK